jgi:hypothetical protein
MLLSYVVAFIEFKLRVLLLGITVGMLLLSL